LASDTVNKAFAPEPSTSHHRRAVFQSMRTLAVQNLRLLRKQLTTLPSEAQPLAQRVLELEPAIIQSCRALCDLRLSAKRLRLHGDCRLGQVLWTGKDFVFIDFEGDTSVPISERRLKHSAMRDLATMLRSFHYAASVGLDQHVERGSIPPQNMLRFQSWLRYWNLWVSVAYLKAYFQAIAGAQILPDDEEAIRVMLRGYLLDRTMNELGRQLRDGNAGLDVSLSGILFLLREPIPGSSLLAVKPPPMQMASAH
jgi:maltose alpha-D-glucosyltransferase/alpha-amylase